MRLLLRNLGIRSIPLSPSPSSSRFCSCSSSSSCCVSPLAPRRLWCWSCSTHSAYARTHTKRLSVHPVRQLSFSFSSVCSVSVSVASPPFSVTYRREAQSSSKRSTAFRSNVSPLSSLSLLSLSEPQRSSNIELFRNLW